MDSNGYVVYQKFIDVPEKVLFRLQRFSNYALPIFNGVGDETNDNLRRQRTVNKSGNIWIRQLVSRLPLGKERQAGTCVVIRSDAGCAAQVPHCDYEPSDAFKKCGDDAVPCGFLVALQDNTHLDVWPGSHKVHCSGDLDGPKALLRRKRLCLNSGDAVLFRGDLIHAGCAYDFENLRLHFYVDHPSLKRPRDRTWLVPAHWLNDATFLGK